MIHTDITKLTDYMLNDVCSITGFGLYNGKLGISLALFESSRYLADETLEEQAFELFQKSLLIKTEDVSFENGLAGVGWALLYLIENKFIDADFDDIFIKEYEQLITRFKSVTIRPHRLVDLTRTIYFLSEIKKIKPNDNRIDYIIQHILSATELYLSVQFLDMSDSNYINKKSTVMNVFEAYLKSACYANHKNYLRLSIDYYNDLYCADNFTQSYAIGYYLEKLLDDNDLEKYAETIADNKKEFSDSKRIDSLSLHERINLLKILDENQPLYETILNSIENQNKDQNMKENILQLVKTDALKSSYKYGVARYLIFKMNRSVPLL